MTTAMSTDAALYRLLAWLSPAYPVGAYTYSHGLEWAVEAGIVRDRAGLVAWLGTVLRHGGGWQDAVFLRTLTERSRIATMPPGGRFVRWPRPGRRPPSWHWRPAPRARPSPPPASRPGPILSGRLVELLGDGAGLTYPLAVGAVAAAHGVPLPLVLPAYLQAFAANLVSAAVRAVPLGQTDGQKALAALEPVVAEVAAAAPACALDDLGTSALMVDLCSMRHETQYTRLFRS